MRPNYIQAVIFFILTSFCIAFAYLIWIHDVSIAVIIFPGIGILIFGILFLDAFNISIGKNLTEDEANKYKHRLLYNNEYFTICTYYFDKKINWENIEAIFYISSPTREGKYYTASYRVILNESPTIVKKTEDRWYDKILPSPKKEKYPEIIIDNHSNIHFYTFHSAIEKYLCEETTTTDYFKERYGNKVEYIRKNENTIVGTPANKQVKSMGFYKIFDRGNIIQDERLIQYRNTIK